MLKQNFRVRYGKADPKHLDYARHAVSVTLLHGMGCGEEVMNTEVTKQVRQNQKRKADALLKMLNGDWRGTTIVHCCTFGCCANSEDSFQQLAEYVRLYYDRLYCDSTILYRPV